MSGSMMLMAHIAAGGTGLATGALALSVAKGQPLHRAAGRVFCAAMLVMSGLGVVIALGLREPTAFVPGLVTFYLVATGWAAARARSADAVRFERGAAVAGAVIAATGAALALVTPEARIILWLFAALSALAAGLDLRVARRGGVAGPARTARHLWRLCTALAIAGFSFFLGQQDEFPEVLKGSHNLVPPLAVLGAMAFWLARLRRRPAAGYSAAKASPDQPHQRWAR